MKVLVFTNMYPFDALPFYGSFVKDEVDALRAAGVEVDVYFVNGKANKMNYLRMPAGFFMRARQKRYDVIHVHHSYCGFVATLQKKVPVVWTFHEGEITGSDEITRRDRATKRLAYSKGFKKSVARKVDALIVVSEHLKEPLERSDAHTIACGIDLELFRPQDKNEAKKKLGLDPGVRYVLFPSDPGRLEKRYGLAAAGVEALRAGGETAELIALHNVQHEDVPVYMNACEVVLMTSEFEASPVSVREALACNVPVVSTAVGDVVSVLEGIDGCYVVEPDAEDIADKLRRSMRRDAPFNGRQKMGPYSLQATAARLIKIYEELSR